MPTVAEVQKTILTMGDQELKQIAPGITAVLSPPSIEQLRQFRQGWDFSRPADEFRTAQAEAIRTCLSLECSEFGSNVRQLLGLPPLTPESEIKLS